MYSWSSEWYHFKTYGTIKWRTILYIQFKAKITFSKDLRFSIEEAVSCFFLWVRILSFKHVYSFPQSCISTLWYIVQLADERTWTKVTTIIITHSKSPISPNMEIRLSSFSPIHLHSKFIVSKNKKQPNQPLIFLILRPGSSSHINLHYQPHCWQITLNGNTLIVPKVKEKFSLFIYPRTIKLKRDIATVVTKTIKLTT